MLAPINSKYINCIYSYFFILCVPLTNAMKHTLYLFAFLILSFCGHAQTITGSYRVTGYFFHPTTSRPLDIVKTITQVNSNVYQVTLGDLGGSNFSFQF